MLKWIWKKNEQADPEADRDCERHDVSFRVVSRDLPGYRALTLDISGSGLQLQTEAMLEKSRILNLQMEFDREELPDFSCPAKVVWSKGEEGSRFFQAGLVFVPESHEQKVNLARMGTVLETRSAADLQDLLDQARRLDPTREAYLAGKNVAGPAPSQNGGFGNLEIPMRVRIDRFVWDRQENRVSVEYALDQDRFQLYFPNCQLCFDYGCSEKEHVAALQIATSSKMLDKIVTERGGTWKHYRFVDGNGKPILDIISFGCQAR